MTFFLSVNVYAGGGKAGTPNGRPFIVLQNANDEANNIIIEVQGTVATIQQQIESLVTQVDTIEERIGANEAAIASLQFQNEELQAQLDAGATDRAAIEAQIADIVNDNADLQVQIDAGDASLQELVQANNSLVTSLNQSLMDIASLEQNIIHNNDLIAAMQQQISLINLALVSKQNVINGECPPGQFIKDVNIDGSTVCETDNTVAGIETVVVANFMDVAPSTYGTVNVLCPEGYTVTGGGYSNYPAIDVVNNLARNNGWEAIAFNQTTTTANLYAIAQCMKLVP